MANTIKGSEVGIGQALYILGRYVRVIAITAYDNDFARSVWPEGGARIATFDIGGGITLEPNGRYQIPA